MTNEQKLIELAHLDGWIFEPLSVKDSFGVHYHEFWRREHETRVQLPNYLANGDEIRRLIGKQSWKVQCEVAIQYRIACQKATTACPTMNNLEGWMVWIMLAPATPLVNALLKATGNWVDSVEQDIVIFKPIAEVKGIK